MRKLIKKIFLITLLFNCTRFVLSPGVNSDIQIELKEINETNEKSKYLFKAFKLNDENLELALYDLNNFSELNPNLIKNYESITKEISNSKLTILIEVFSENGLNGLDELTSIELTNSNCNKLKYQIYRYDYIKFLLVKGYRSTIYPKYPEEKYLFEFTPKMANVEIKELPRKRMLIYFDNSCDLRYLKSIDFKLNSQKFIKYSIILTPSA